MGCAGQMALEHTRIGVSSALLMLMRRISRRDATAADLVQYESTDLKHWRFTQFVRRDSFAYDSDVFRIADGRWILFSTGQTRDVRGKPMPLQSTDLRNWSTCTDPVFQVDVDEGPHASWNDATIKWHNYSYINWDGSAHRGSQQPNMLRSSNGGLRWEHSNNSLYGAASSRWLDIGNAHQGPVLLNQGPDGNDGWGLYFTEFSVSAQYAAATGCGRGRSVLQLARLEVTQDGWLAADREYGPPLDLKLAPPPDWHPTQELLPAVWAIAKEEAMVIMLAEINRWHPGWFAKSWHVAADPLFMPPKPEVHEVVSSPEGITRVGWAIGTVLRHGMHPACISECKADDNCVAASWIVPPGTTQCTLFSAVSSNNTDVRWNTWQSSVHVVCADCSLEGGFYESRAVSIRGCVSACLADTSCLGVTWKHVNASGSGIAVTSNCTGLAGQPCCYMQTASAGAHFGGLSTKFDCWEKRGVEPAPAPAPPLPSVSCCCAASGCLPTTCNGAGGAGVNALCPSQMWRNPEVAQLFFTPPAGAAHSIGTGKDLLWNISFSSRIATSTGGSNLPALNYRALVAANGTILEVVDTSTQKPLFPLRQFRFDGLSDAGTTSVPPMTPRSGTLRPTALRVNYLANSTATSNPHRIQVVEYDRVPDKKKVP